MAAYRLLLVLVQRYFSPYENLGLIIIDEEHDSAYKQEDRVFYHARDMAVVRSMLGNFPCILSSATASLESRVNAMTGRYHHVRLSERFQGAELPEIKSIDLRQHPPTQGRVPLPPIKRCYYRHDRIGQANIIILKPPRVCPLNFVSHLRT